MATPAHFQILPSEDREAYTRLLDAYIAEYQPCTPTEDFLVTELAHAQWRINRADAIEAELLEAPDRDLDALNRLGRYAQSARRAYYKAHEKLQELRRETRIERREATRDYERRMNAYIEAPPPTPERPVQIPLPPDLQAELDRHRRRDPDFDPIMDASQMSKRLRRWFERRQAEVAATAA